MTLKVGGLFSGIGGFELGLKLSGMKIHSLCEIEEPCQRVLNKHFPESKLHDDVFTIPDENVSGVDVLCGGFPCQDISISGKGAGINGEQSGLWKEYKNVIKKALPKYAIIENVSALRSRGLEVVLQDLAEIGYDATWTMLDSKFFGQPQRRRRIYIVAVRDGIPAGADLLKFKKRNTDGLRHEVESFDSCFEWDFKLEDTGGKATSYYTRQRIKEFDTCGLSSALCKRDYKSYTDIIVQDGIPRRVTPEERLILQGFPSTYFDGLNLTQQQQFMYCGMSVNTVKWIGECVMEFDREYS